MDLGSCPRCKTSFRMDELESRFEPLEECCLEALQKVQQRLFQVTFKFVLLNIPRAQEKAQRFNRALMDAAMTSPDPEVRQAAIRWRNENPPK